METQQNTWMPPLFITAITGQSLLLCNSSALPPLRWERPSGCAASLGVGVGLAKGGGRDAVVWRAQRPAAGGTDGRISGPH